MRIIAGKYKGHHLVSFKADHIRPTTDRVKESLFNKLMFDMEGSKVLDLFCGTGNLGLEAISRGAEFVTFVDDNRKSLEITMKNIEKLKVSSTDYRVMQADVLKFLKNYTGEPVNIIFADPPFTEKMAHEVMLCADVSAAFGPQTVLAIESAGKERIDDQYPSLERFDAREYGDKVLSFYRKKGQI
jgi:16S rRNA (guanine966-N2)-methyltransferase